MLLKTGPLAVTSDIMVKKALPKAPLVESEYVSYRSRNGKQIAAYVDRPASGQAFHGSYVVVSPKYGETKKNNLQLAYFLAANGLGVLRFDHTDHLGSSEGNQLNFTLPSGVDDILASFDYLEQNYGVASATLLASSLSARTAVRAASMDTRVCHLACLVGVVNVQHTLREVYKEDLVANYINGKRWGVTDILGVEIDFDHFLAEAIRSGMHDLEGTMVDLGKIKVPVSLFPADKDVWVLLDEVKKAASRARAAQLYPILDAMHEIRENPQAADKAMADLVGVCVRIGAPGQTVEEGLREPDKKEVVRQNKIEREQLRTAKPLAESERDFWAGYLGKYKMLENVEDYRGYLDTVGRMLGPIGPGDLVLDAGCGNGFFGLWVARDLIRRASTQWTVPPVYLGLDLTREGLQAAVMKQLAQIRAGLEGKVGVGSGAVGFMHSMVNFDVWDGDPDGGELVLFEDGCFDKICCSLVLSYLRNPQGLVSELYRILKPGGRMMLSSMKPYCDMSVIYRDYMDQSVSSEELESGRDLLRAAGAIRLKEEQGHYAFFSAEDLVGLARAAGFSDINWDTCFGGQAVAIIAVK